jgi:hypothetical protein
MHFLFGCSPYPEHDLDAAVERWREKYRAKAMLPIEWIRQVEAMQNAGRSPEEIKAWLDRQKAELPASPVDDNPAPPPSSTA